MADCRIWLEKVPLDRSAVVSLYGMIIGLLDMNIILYNKLSVKK